MGEVGDQGAPFHAEVGAFARERGIGALWATGELATHAVQAFGPGGRHFARAEDLLQALAADEEGVVTRAAAVLVKGSRFMRMERMVDALVGSPIAQ